MFSIMLRSWFARLRKPMGKKSLIEIDSKLTAIGLSDAALDQQSPVKIAKWLDVDSEECRNCDPDLALTKKWIKLLMSGKDPALFTDASGRIWGKGNEGKFYPFHFDYGTLQYGFKIVTKAFS